MKIILRSLLHSAKRGLVLLKSMLAPAFIMLAAGLFAGDDLEAQVASNYFFYQYNETYNPGISGSATPATNFTATWDDNTTTYPIPFNFTYNGVAYTTAGQIGVDTDGWMAFSTGTITMTGQLALGSWVAIGDQTGYYLKGNANNNGFAGFNGDLVGQTFPTITATTVNGSNILTGISSFANIQVGTRIDGTGITAGTVVNAVTATTITLSAPATASGMPTLTPASSIYGFTRGTAPYRQFVVQWTQAKRYSGTGTENFNFQLVINEGGGLPLAQTLQAVYGTCTTTSTTDLNVQVGLRGNSAADYNARTSTSNWAATTANTTNAQTIKFNNTIFPANSQVFNWSPQCLVSPSAAGVISGPNPICPNQTFIYSLAGVPNANYYTWTYSGTGATFSLNTTLPSNTFIFGPGVTGGTITVTPVNLCGSGTSSTLTLSVNAGPTAAISYPLPSYCVSAAGTVSVTQTGTTGGTYSATPAGLAINPATGLITPSASSAGIYTVTYSFNSGSCTGTATAGITLVANPVVNTSASPSLLCSAGGSQLQTTISGDGLTYTVSSIPHNSLSPSGTPTVLFNSYSDDGVSPAVPMPFTFVYFGSTITQFYAAVNGHIQLETNSGTGVGAQTLPSATTPNNVIALAWRDLKLDPSLQPGSYIRYFVNGTAPNRVLVVDYFKLVFFTGASASQNMTGQIRLYENDSHIEIAATTVNDNANALAKTLGIENSTGTVGYAPAGRNNVVWNVSTPEAWSFIPVVGSYTYAWSPAGTLSNAAIKNPVATPGSTTTYTVQATSVSSGCTGTGTVTVTVTAPLSGTYTVGVAGNYPTLTAAVNAYNTVCIGGPVTFSLIDASYGGSETFPVTINSNTYASATNTLTIKPAIGVNPTITGNNSVGILKLNGADYVTIDGSNTAGGTSRNLSVINNSTNSTTSTIIWLNSVNAANGATNNTIKNCIITGNAPTTTFTAVISSGTIVGDIAEAANSNNTYRNNLFTRCQTAIAVVGPTGNETGNVIAGNTIGSVTVGDKLGWSGIELYQQANSQVNNNTVFGVTTTTSTTTSGISIYGTASAITIDGNKISDIKNSSSTGFGCNGIYLGATSTASNITVSNNFIFDIAARGYLARGEGDNGYGIIVDDGGGYNIYYNTVHLNTSQTSDGYPACLHITSYVTTAASINIKNNIFSNAQTNSSQRYAIQANAASTVLGTINYNVYYTAGANLGYIGSNRAALANIQAGFGQNGNSLVYLPAYTSATDYHILATNAGNVLNLENKGNPIAGLTSDYDAQTRNGLNPDVGADEWVKPNYGSWVGKTSIDWLVPTNWEANFIPNDTTDVYINGGYTFMPTIATTQAVRALNLSAPGSPPILTINGGTLQVYGLINRTGGTVIGSNGTLEMNGPNGIAQTIPASLFTGNNLKNLVIGNADAAGVSLGGALDIYGTLSFTGSNKLFTTNGNLTLKSTATTTANVAEIPVNGLGVAQDKITGDVTVERYIPARRAWRFLSVPTTGNQLIHDAWQEGQAPNATTPAGFGIQLTGNFPNGFDLYSLTPSLKTYAPGSNTWVAVLSTLAKFTPNTAYMVFIRGDRTVNSFGQAPTLTVLRTKDSLYTGNQPAVAMGAAQFAAISNPYASSIDFTKVNRVNVDNKYYVYDPALGTLGGFQTFLKDVNGDYRVVLGGGSYGNAGDIFNHIQSGQAFFVYSTPGGGTVSLQENDKSNNFNMVFGRLNMRQSLKLYTKLYATGPGGERLLLDGVLNEFARNYSNAVDEEDARKSTNFGENLSIVKAGSMLVAERRGLLNERDTIYYNLSGARAQEYQFEFIAESLDPGLSAWLEDSYLHSSQPVSLRDTTRIMFSITSDPGSYAFNRFRLVFMQRPKIDPALLNSLVSAKGTPEPVVAEQNNTGDIQVYPNPVTDKHVRLQFNKQAPGEYLLQLRNNLGQVVYSGTILLADKEQHKSINVPTLPVGNYQLIITGPGGSRVSRQLLLQ